MPTIEGSGVPERTEPKDPAVCFADRPLDAGWSWPNRELKDFFTRVNGPLHMAKIELSVLARQCLDRRLPDVETLTREVAAWEEARNSAEMTVRWQFTTEQARIKLKKLYPIILP